MAAQSNILKLLQSLGGMASESYGQGSSMMPRKGGQPILPKPEISMPHNMSPYAPGNQSGGPMAAMGAVNGYDQPNHTKGAKPNQMSHMEPSHPITQLASYLQTQGGMSATAPGGLKMRKSVGTQDFLRGGAGVQ